MISEADRDKSPWHEAYWQVQQFIKDEKPSQADVEVFSAIVGLELPAPRSAHEHRMVAEVKAMMVADRQAEEPKGAEDGQQVSGG